MPYLALIYGAALAVFISCNASTVHKEDPVLGADTIKLRYATGFQIVNLPQETIVTVFNPWNKGQVFAKYTIGSEAKKLNAISDQLLSEPPSRIGVSSSTAIGYLTILGSQNLIAGICDGELVYDNSLYSRFMAGKIPSLGRQMVDSYESIIDAQLDGYIKSGFEQSPAQDARYLLAGLPIIYLNDWTESHPLARAEWIKFIACFTGQSAKADSIFAQIECRYNAAKDKAQNIAVQPSVIAGGAFKGEWFVPAGRSYFAHLIKDAHGSYLWATDTSVGSITLSFEEVFAKSSEAEIWLSTQDLSPRQLIGLDSRLSYFRSLKDNRIYTYNKRIGASGGNDYWESGVCRPDLILEDIIAILHPSMSVGSLYYFSNVSDPKAHKNDN